MNIIHSNKIDMIKNLLNLNEEKIESLCQIILKTSKLNKIYCIGNGGSASISNHFVCDLVKGMNYDKNFKLFSLSSNIEVITAISNDIKYEDIFSFQIEKYAEKNDILIAISSSGKSKNILKGIKAAKKKLMKIVSLTGFNGGEVIKLSDFNININSKNYGVIEDMHSFIMHLVCQKLHAKD